jgi:hypothetical protein
MQQNEMDRKWAGILPFPSCLEGTTQIRRFVVRTETSVCRRGLDRSQHRGLFVVFGSINGLASVTKSKVAGVFLVTGENCLFSPTLESIAVISPARHVLTAVKLPSAPSFWRVPLPWHPSFSAASDVLMAQNVAEQIGAHSGPITTASSATIATVAAQRFFRGNFVSLFTTLISYLLGLGRSTRLLIPYFSVAISSFVCSTIGIWWVWVQMGTIEPRDRLTAGAVAQMDRALVS